MYRNYFLCSFCVHAVYDSIRRKKKWVLNVLGALASISNTIRLTTQAFPDSGVRTHTHTQASTQMLVILLHFIAVGCR